MIHQVQFSAGGFEASYGDKLSSVLDITYKSFSKNQTLLSLSRLGGNLSWSLGNEKCSVVSGVRYRDNGLLVDQKKLKPILVPVLRIYKPSSPTHTLINCSSIY